MISDLTVSISQADRLAHTSHVKKKKISFPAKYLSFHSILIPPLSGPAYKLGKRNKVAYNTVSLLNFPRSAMAQEKKRKMI